MRLFRLKFIIFSIIAFYAAQGVAQVTPAPKISVLVNKHDKIPTELKLKQSTEATPQVKKLNLESDRVSLRDGFKAFQRSGTESGGGGSENRNNFYAPLRKAITVLKTERTYRFDDKKILEIEDLENALRAITLIPTSKQLRDRENVAVDLLNDSDDLLIWFNIFAWNSFDEDKKIQLGLHELLGILKIPDPGYKYSYQLLMAFKELSNNLPASSEVKPSVVDQKFVFEFLQNAKAANQPAVLSHSCEKFAPSHDGFCLIENQMRNGKSYQIVYLVSGSPEQFANGGKGSVRKLIIRVVTEVSQADVDFVLAVAKADRGTAELFNRDQCVSLGLVDQMNENLFCVLVKFSEM